MQTIQNSASLDARTAPYALLLLPILLTAAWVHFPHGRVFTSAGGGWEYPVFLAVASAVHALAGDGAFALKLPRIHSALVATGRLVYAKADAVE